SMSNDSCCRVPERDNIRPDKPHTGSAKAEIRPALSAQVANSAFSSVTRAASTAAGHSFFRHHLGGVSARSTGSRSHVRDLARAALSQASGRGKNRYLL